MKTLLIIISIIILSIFSNCPEKVKTVKNRTDLQIGDYWIYQNTLYGLTDRIVSDFRDTVSVVNDTIIDGKKYFINNKNEFLAFDNGRIMSYIIANSLEKPLFPICNTATYLQKIELVGTLSNGEIDTTKFTLNITCKTEITNINFSNRNLKCNIYSSPRVQSTNRNKRNFSFREVFYNDKIGKIREENRDFLGGKVTYESELIETSLIN